MEDSIGSYPNFSLHNEILGSLMICMLRINVKFDAMDQHDGYCRYRCDGLKLSLGLSLNLHHQTYSGSTPLQLPHPPDIIFATTPSSYRSVSDPSRGTKHFLHRPVNCRLSGENARGLLSCFSISV